MAAEKSWSNPGFQADEYGMPQMIPRAAINREASNRKMNAESETLRNGNRVPPFSRQDEGPPEHPEKTEYSISMPQSEVTPAAKEDYSLRSYFKDLECYNYIEHTFKRLTKGINFRRLFKILFSVILLLLYIAYFVFVLVLQNEIQEGQKYWCQGNGFLIILTCFVLIFVVYFKLFKPYIGIRIYKLIKSRCKESSTARKAQYILDLWFIKLILYTVVIACIVIFLIIDSGTDRSRLVSLLGIVVFILFGFLFSVAPRKVIWRHVIWGLGLQFILGLMILRWQLGRAVFSCLGDKVQTFLSFTNKGSTFVFGRVVSELHVFAFEVLTTILFFGFCIQILYYYGAMQWLVLKLGWFLQVTIGTTACESTNAAANIFLGQSEAPLLIKPFLTKMTKSELHAVLTGGFATIAGTVLAAYISFGVDPAHLLSASVMSAPAALGFSKLFYPETEESQTKAKDIDMKRGTETNVLHAACEGIINAIPLVANIATYLVVFIAFIAFIDAILNWACVLITIEDGTCSLANIFGYVFMPLAYIMGVPSQDCYYVGQLIGTKTFINEFVGYLKLAEYMKNDEISKRSEIISTYALCGFSNVASIGIQLGALGAMAPERRGDIAQIILRAMIAGSIACFLTACVAGTLIQADETATHLSNVTSAIL